VIGIVEPFTLEAELHLLELEVRTGVSLAVVPPKGTAADRWMGWYLDFAAWANLLATADAARTFLEDRYLGMSALFPDLAEDWARLLAQVDELAGLAAAGPVAPGGMRRGPGRPIPTGSSCSCPACGALLPSPTPGQRPPTSWTPPSGAR